MALLVMVYGFIIIEKPEKLLSSPEAEDAKGEIEVEVESEVAVAEDAEEADDVEQGEVASTERMHYDQLIRKMQNEGVEREYQFITLNKK